MCMIDESLNNNNNNNLIIRYALNATYNKSIKDNNKRRKNAAIAGTRVLRTYNTVIMIL